MEEEGLKSWQATSVRRDLWNSKGKGNADWRENDVNAVDEVYYGESSFSSSSSDTWSLQRWSADDLSSRGETSSRVSSSSGTSSSSSNRKSSRSRSSSASQSRRRSRKSERSVPCIRTMFSNEELVSSRKNFNRHLSSVDQERFDTDANSASEDDSSSSSEQLTTLRFSSVTSSFKEYDRHQRNRNEAFWGEGNELFEKGRKSAWRKLRHRRLLTNLFNFKPQNGSGFSSGQEPQSMLVDIHVLGSPGPIRLVVDKNEVVQHVIELALQAYGCQKRQPPLGVNHRQFVLYCQTPEFDAMDEKSCVGEYGARHFYLYPKAEREEEQSGTATPAERIKGSSSFRSWFFSGVQSWGSFLINTLNRNVVCLASSFYHLNFDSVMCAMLKALR